MVMLWTPEDRLALMSNMVVYSAFMPSQLGTTVNQMPNPFQGLFQANVAMNQMSEIEKLLKKDQGTDWTSILAQGAGAALGALLL